MKSFYYCLFLLPICVVLFCSCSGGLEAAKTPLIIPDFNYSPPSPVAPGSAGIKVALLEPVYLGSLTYTNQSPFKQFRGSMGNDFQQILTAHGYILKGPYDSYDLMTYSDKNECQLGLKIEIDLNAVQTSGGWTYIPLTSYGYGITSGNYSTYEGILNLSGKITIAVFETFTQQKLLVKSVSVPQEDINVKAEAQFAYGSTGIPIGDPGVHNPIAISLAKFYKSVMKLGWDMLSEDELKHVQNQVPAIRENAGFIKR